MHSPSHGHRNVSGNLPMFLHKFDSQGNLFRTLYGVNSATSSLHLQKSITRAPRIRWDG